MENAADALKMAGAVLLFVLALSIIILSFVQVRQNVDLIINYKDRETFYIESKYYYVGNTNERTVNLETIIPTVFRAYLENYKIVFDGLQKPLYKINATYKEDNGTMTTKELERKILDLETNANTKYQNVVLANDDQKREFLCGILYGDFSISGSEDKFQKKFNVSLEGCESLYKQLKNKNNITESLGVYYQNDSPLEPNVNKTEKRVITYHISN